MDKAAQIFQNFLDSILTLIRVLILSKFDITLPEEKESIVILGNGPSLKNTLSENLDFITSSDKKRMAVNMFCNSDSYTTIKPEYYILNAPEFFRNVVTEMWEEMRWRVFQNLKEKTNWEMTLLVPAVAAKSENFKKFSNEQTKIKIVYYNTTPAEGFTSLIQLLFKSNLGMPRPHNVLVPSIFLSLNMGFKEIFLVGADHSWHEDIKVDETNKTTVNHEHFYDAGKVTMPMYKLDGEEYRIHDIFRKLHLAFKGYFIIKDYAEELNAKIFNASVRSYIDAFPKTKIK
ncbi:MAG: hypothetical protein M0P71_05315 [Melioribacteraceae bacterium]|nr:hypothetical protein [Melioribacteraceae bacterium]